MKTIPQIISNFCIPKDVRPLYNRYSSLDEGKISPMGLIELMNKDPDFRGLVKRHKSHVIIESTFNLNYDTKKGVYIYSFGNERDINVKEHKYAPTIENLKKLFPNLTTEKLKERVLSYIKLSVKN